MKIYLLQVMCCFNEEEHYEDIYSNKEKAVEKGLIWLDDSLKRQYNNLFEEADEKSIPELKREQLFKLKSIYDFSITEYDPKIVDECDEIENLLAVENYDLYGLLDENTRIVADARVKYPEVSMQELADIITLENNYKIGKSGVNHHFIKINNLVKRHKERSEENGS